MKILENGVLKEKEYDKIDNEASMCPFQYQEFVVMLIRQKYSIDEELAIQRQRDIKPEEFREYFDYCEECK